MEEKISRLQKATDEAESQMKRAKEKLEDSETRLDAAKQLLKNLGEDDQKKILVTDTKLPELLDLHAIAKEEYDVAKKRFETNTKYLTALTSGKK